MSSGYFERKKVFDEMDQKLRREEEVLKASTDDPLKGWTEVEIKAIEGDPEYRNQIEESRLARRIKARQEQQLFENKRLLADLKVKSLPEANNPAFQTRINAIIDRYGLHGNPNARYLAAKLARAEQD